MFLHSTYAWGSGDVVDRYLLIDSCITIAFLKGGIYYKVIAKCISGIFLLITLKQVPITSGHVLQGNNVNYTKIHVWVHWSASSVLAKKIQPAL